MQQFLVVLECPEDRDVADIDDACRQANEFLAGPRGAFRVRPVSEIIAA